MHSVHTEIKYAYDKKSVYITREITQQILMKFGTVAHAKRCEATLVPVHTSLLTRLKNMNTKSNF
jgi:hypothetical protein